MTMTPALPAARTVRQHLDEVRDTRAVTLLVLDGDDAIIAYTAEDYPAINVRLCELLAWLVPGKDPVGQRIQTHFMSGSVAAGE